MPNFHGRTALVTGSSQGIGSAIAISLAKSGANLVLHGLKRDAAAEASIAACREFDVRVSFVEGDLAAPNNKAANRIAAEANVSVDQLEMLFHGFTIATNAWLTRTGASHVQVALRYGTLTAIGIGLGGFVAPRFGLGICMTLVVLVLLWHLGIGLARTRRHVGRFESS